MVINKKPKDTVPATLINLFFDQFALAFNDAQYFDLLSLANFFVSSARLHEYRSLRPAQGSVKDEPLAWFRYAAKAYLRLVHERNRRLSWRYILQRRKDRAEYSALFFEKLQTQHPSAGMLEALEALERRLDYVELKRQRSLARKQFNRLLATQEAERKQAGWLHWLMSPAVSSQVKPIAEMINEEDLKELYATIDFDKEEARSSPFSPTRQLFQLCFELGTGSINLGKARGPEEVSSVASVIFRLLSGSVLKRGESLRVETKLHEFLVVENLLENSLFPEIIKSRPGKYNLDSSDEEDPFLALEYDQLTTNPDANSSLLLKMQPLLIVANYEAASLFTDFVVGGRNKELIDSLMGLAVDQLSEFKVWSQSSFDKAVDQHKGVDFFIDIDAPILVVPEDCTSADKFAFVVDLGCASLRSELVTAEQKRLITDSKEGETLSRVKLHSVKDLLYDYIKASLTAVQLLYFDNIKDCQKFLKGSQLSALPEDIFVVDKVNLDLSIGSCILPPNSELPGTTIKGSVPMVDVNFSDAKWKSFMHLINKLLPPSSHGDGANMLSSASSLFELGGSKPGSLAPVLLLPKVPAPGDEGSEEDEFQDAVEDPDDLMIQEKSPHDVKSLDMVFSIEQVKGRVTKVSTEGRKGIAKIEVDSLKVVIENRPHDICVKSYLKAFKFEDLLGDTPQTLVNGRGVHEDSVGGLMAVSVTLVNPLHPLFKSKYSSASILVDVDISSILATLDSPKIMSIVRFATDTFAPDDKEKAPVSLRKKPGSLKRSFSRLSQSAFKAGDWEDRGRVQDSKYLVNIRLLELGVSLGPERACIGDLHLRSAAIGVVYHGDGKLILQGKLSSLDVTPSTFGIGVYTSFKGRQFATVEGRSVVDFTYETFVDELAADYPGHDVGLTLKSGSIHMCYMPQFLRQLFDLLADLRNAAGILTAKPQATVHDVDAKASKFHYEIEILSPIIDLVSPSRPEEKLAFYPGNLSVSNLFVVNKQDPYLWDTFIDVSLRAVHVDVWHYHSRLCPLQLSSLVESLDIDVRVTQAYSPEERSYAPLDVEVSLGQAKCRMGNTEYTLSVGLFNWFLATYPSVMDRINKFLASGSPEAPTPAPSPALDRVAMEVNVMIDALEMAVFSYQINLPEVPADAVPLSNLVFKDISVNHLANANGSFAVEARFDSMSLRDSRPDPGRCFTTIFAPGKGKTDPDAPMILARYERLVPTQQILTKVTVDTPQVLLVMDHLFSMKRFFSDGLPSKELIRDPLAAAHNSQSQQGMPDKYDTSTVVAVVRASGFVLEDPYNASSEAVLISFPEIVFTANGGDAIVSVDKASLAFCNMDDQEATRLDFVDTFCVTATVENSRAADASEPVQVSRTTVNVTPVVMRFAYQDMAILQSLVSQFTALRSDEGAQGQEAIEEGLDKTVEDMMRMSLGAAEPAAASGPAPATRSSYRVGLESFRAVFVDDFNKVNRPFIEWLVRNLSGEFSSTAGAPMQGGCSFLTHMTSYNLCNSHWEPLLEQMQLTLSMLPEAQESGEGTFPQMTLSSEQGLDAIVSHAFLQQLHEFSAGLATMAEAKLTAHRQVALPYMLHNHTGLDLEFWATPDRRASTAAGHSPTGRVQIAAGAEQPWTLQDWKSLRSSVEAVTPRISCRLLDSPFEAIEAITIDQAGIFSYALRPRLEDTAHKLIVDIYVRKGVKHIAFRPAFVFSNQSKFPVELICEGMDVAKAITVQPGQASSFPVTQDIKMGSIKLRPLGLGYDWCDQAIPVDGSLFQSKAALESGKAAPVQAACSHLADTQLHPPFFYVLHGEVEAGRLDVRLPAADTVAVVRLRAPLQFMNQLPYRIAYRIFDRTAGFDFGAALVPGAVTQLHFVNLAHVIGLSVEIEEAGMRAGGVGAS